jgi:hypothetical protein
VFSDLSLGDVLPRHKHILVINRQSWNRSG